jgi:mannose-1-phosphate guanylyltransferase
MAVSTEGHGTRPKKGLRFSEKVMLLTEKCPGTFPETDCRRGPEKEKEKKKTIIDLSRIMEANSSNHSYCVILCGGRGNRLWPLSREAMPKQFQDFLKAGASQLQQTYRRFATIFPKERILVATNQAYRDIVHEQLPDLPAENILEEPILYDTAPVFMRTACHIAAKDPEAIVLFTPCDHYIVGENEFLNHVIQCLDFAGRKKEGLVTLGIRPTNAETAYGYIQLADTPEEGNFRRIKAFTEKPEEEQARLFIESGEFYWNSGLIFGQAENFIEEIKFHLPEVASVFMPAWEKKLFGTDEEQEYVDKYYSYLPRVSFEYGVMEKISNAYILPTSDFVWTDIGTWTALYELSEKDAQGNAAIKGCKVISREASGNLIALPEGKLAVLKDLEGYLIAEADGILLVCKRDDRQSLRALQGAVMTQDDGERYQ